MFHDFAAYTRISLADISDGSVFTQGCIGSGKESCAGWMFLEMIEDYFCYSTVVSDLHISKIPKTLTCHFSLFRTYKGQNRSNDIADVVGKWTKRVLKWR